MLKQVIPSIKKILAPLAPPVFPDDEDKTRKARYANLIALIFLGAVIAFQAWARLIQGYADLSWMDGVMLPIVGVCVASLLLLRRGHVQSGSIMLVVIIWAASNGMAAVSFGVKDVTYIANFAVVLMASLLLG